MPFSNLKFTTHYIDALPADTDQSNAPRHSLHSAYSFVIPVKSSNSQLIAYSSDLAKKLGIIDIDKYEAEFSAFFTGTTLPENMKPYAMCYGGYQFGHWAGQLGDGRAINLGELAINGSSNCYQTLQLKGAGPTPYSRSGDGFAVLRSSIREYLCSEAMYHLGIPTTRALSLCLTGDEVIRDMLYDGHAKFEPTAVVCRVSSSFTRFGQFQLASKRNDQSLLAQLADQCIESDYPELLMGDLKPDKDVYIAWFEKICQRTCSLVVNWARVGFVHGVMNTDNMSIIGETIDYGPYGWLDNFDPEWTPNTSDNQDKRYRFSNQAKVAQWNLFQLANAIYPLINEVEPLQKLVDNFLPEYENSWQLMMIKKLGFQSFKGEKDQLLLTNLTQILEQIETDMTIFYRQLAKLPLQVEMSQYENWFTVFSSCFYRLEDVNEHYIEMLSDWIKSYIQRALMDDRTALKRQSAMNLVNPKYILRNYLTQNAIELAEQGNFSEIKKLQRLLQAPYSEQPAFERYAQKRPESARNKVGCAALSCSS